MCLVMFVCLWPRLNKHCWAVWQEAWCKKGPPPATLVLVQPSRASMPAAPDAAKIIQLQRVAEPLGSLIQYSHQGFLPNKRQQLMAGFAIIEGGQFIRRLVSCPSLQLQVASSSFMLDIVFHVCKLVKLLSFF